MATTKLTAEELDRRIDARLRLRGQRLYCGADGERFILNRFQHELAASKIEYAGLVLELNVLKPDEEIQV